MKKTLFLLLILFSNLSAPAQEVENTFRKDSLFILPANPAAGFNHPYLLYIPKGVSKDVETYLLVEPNNTGRTSDSLQVHLKAARHLAAKSSVGNNVASELKIPLLVPVFPRSESKPLVYTHALDQDVMQIVEGELKRLDLQLLAMVEDARRVLKSAEIPLKEKIFMTGFSASGSFVNRFAFIHPKNIAALATGGLNGILMLPLNNKKGLNLPYPLGTYNLQVLTGKNFDRESYFKIPQFIYMGALDDNDAVKYNDAYSNEEREIIYATIGEEMQPLRWQNCQEIYGREGVNAIFQTYPGVGHGTTSEMNLEIINFFAAQKNNL